MTAYNETMGTNYLLNNITRIEILGQDWILAVIIAFLIVLIITREYNKWPVYMFPAYVMAGLIGFGTNTVIMVILGAVMVFQIVGVERVGELALGTYRTTTSVLGLGSKMYGGLQDRKRETIKQAKLDKKFKEAKLQIERSRSFDKSQRKQKIKGLFGGISSVAGGLVPTGNKAEQGIRSVRGDTKVKFQSISIPKQNLVKELKQEKKALSRINKKRNIKTYNKPTSSSKARINARKQFKKKYRYGFQEYN